MKVIRAEVLGFCMGVRRAVELALKERAKTKAVRIFSLGHLVHNPKVLADLQEQGIETVYELPQNLDNSVVLIRAHGISPVIEEELRGRGAKIVDATCPNVKACQLKAQRYAAEGYCLFLAGEAKHAEIEGILGYAGNFAAGAQKTLFCSVIGTAEEAKNEAAKLFEKDKNAKTALIGQTTISHDEYLRITEAVKEYFPNLEAASTICGETKERQDSLRRLLEKTQAVIIAGGKESSNTRRLLAIAKESGKPCALVEDSNEIPEDFFSFNTVGISAGASTPDSVIDEIEQKLLKQELLNYL